MEQFRNPRVVLGAATVTALLAGLFAFLHFSQSGANRRATPAPAPMIVRATQDLGPGTVITPEMVERAPLTRGTRAEGAVTELASAVGRVVLAPVSAGETLRSENVASPSAALGPSYTLSPSQRAVTVALPSPAALVGFLKPGDHVDVLATFSRDDEAVTRTILQDVLVIAVGMETERTTPSAESTKTASNTQANVRTEVPVTVAVSPPDAERLVLADTQGRVRLVLRSAGGGGGLAVSSEGARQSDMSGLWTGPAVAAAPARPLRTMPAREASELPPRAADPRPATPSLPGTAAEAVKSKSDPAEPPVETITVLRGSRVEQVPIKRTGEAAPASTPESAGKRSDGATGNQGALPGNSPAGFDDQARKSELR